MSELSAVPATQAARGVSLVEKFAQRYSIESAKLLSILKATAFKAGKNEPDVTNEQMAALLVVADQYKLNPFTRELFAFNDSRKGIVPIVSVDGWLRIINDHPQMNGIEFTYGGDKPDWIECVIYRKDRDHPTKAKELMAECRRDTGPWNSHPSRMLRHKALIQCARIAFGFAGIYDEDEADRIRAGEIEINPAATAGGGAVSRIAAAVGATPAGAAGTTIDGDTGEVLQGAGKPAEKAADAGDDQLRKVEGAAKAEPAKAPDGREVGTNERRDEIIAKLQKAETVDALAEEADKANLYSWTAADLGAINAVYHERIATLSG